jgi:hypothetical protein
VGAEYYPTSCEMLLKNRLKRITEDYKKYEFGIIPIAKQPKAGKMCRESSL